MFENAIEYAKLGFKVFPVDSKMMALKSWQDEATSNPKKISELFKVPHTGIGILIGQKSGLTVIGIDLKEGRNGFKTLDDLGIGFSQFEETVCFDTGMGSWQYIFKYCRKVFPGTGVFVKDSGINIFNYGALSIFPPSIHPDNGKPGKWISGQSPAEVEVAPFPDDFLEVYKEHTRCTKKYRSYYVKKWITDRKHYTKVQNCW